MTDTELKRHISEGERKVIPAPNSQNQSELRTVFNGRNGTAMVVDSLNQVSADKLDAGYSIVTISKRNTIEPHNQEGNESKTVFQKAALFIQKRLSHSS